MSQIRIKKTPEVKEVLDHLRNRYRLLSEADVIKLALSELFAKEENIPYVDEETEKLIAQGMRDIKEGNYTEVGTEEELDNYLKSIK